MIPILFDKSEKSFSSNGLGGLPDCISCVVTEERNGMYELEMQYPMSGIHFSDIAVDCFVLAKPNITKRAQPFRIYKITRPIGGIVTVNAEHISYQANHIPVMPFTASNAAEATSKIISKSAYECPFNITTSLPTTAEMAITEPRSMRTLLFGSEGSFLDVYGGEFDYDFYDITIKKSRGSDNGATLEYGKNITDIKQDENISETITGICPYATRSSGTSGGETETETLTLPEKYIEKAQGFAYKRIIPVDLSDKMPEDDWSVNRLRAEAEKYCSAHKIGTPTVSIDVSFVALGDTEEYSELKNLERVSLCDYVTVKFPMLGIDAKAKVEKTVFNTLLEKYESITVGSISRTISDTISAQEIEQENVVKLSRLESELKRQAAMITGNAGDSYVILYPRYNTKELLVMDTNNPNTATNVWRFNKNGMAHGTNYQMTDANVAITMDGHIAGQMIMANSIEGAALKANAITADKIAAGAITADKLEASVLSAPVITSGSIGGWTITNIGISSERLFGSLKITAYMQMPQDEGAYVYMINHNQIVVYGVNTNGDIHTGGKIIAGGNISTHSDLIVAGEARLSTLSLGGYEIYLDSSGVVKWR